MFKMFINTLNKKIPFCITLSNHKQACGYDSFCISNYFIFETQTAFDVMADAYFLELLHV